MKLLNGYSSDIFRAIELCNYNWRPMTEFGKLCRNLKFFEGNEETYEII